MIFDKIIFIHIPKCCGSSIRSSLSESYKFLFNATIKNFKNLKEIDQNDNFENYNFKIKSFKDHLPFQLIKKTNLHKNKFIFTSVRNPFSRMVSLYYECRNSKVHRNRFKKINNFPDFVESVIKNPYWFPIPMVDYIGINNLKKLNFICKYENFNEDIIRLNKYINMSIKHHNHNNSVKNFFKFSDYRKFYKNKDLILNVKEYYKKDFLYFNYSYNDFLFYENKNKNKINILKNIFHRKMFNLFK